MEPQPNPIETPDSTPENTESAREETTSPLKEHVFPDAETALPTAENPFPREETMFPSPETMFPSPESSFSAEKTSFSTEETSFPVEQAVSAENLALPFEAPPAAPIQGEVVREVPKEKSNLFLRVVTALIGIPIVWWVDWRAGPRTFNLVVAILALLSLRELGIALRKGGFSLVRGLAYPSLLALLCAQRFAENGSRGGALLIWTLPFVLLVGLLIEGVLCYSRQQRLSLQSIALTLLATFYAGLFVFLILLRSLKWPALAGDPDFNALPPEEVLPHLIPSQGPQLGMSLLWLTLMAVWSGDTVAYFAGRWMGKEKLTPLSPGKTWEGAVAGLTATIVVCVPVGHLLGIEPRHCLALGVLIALAAPLGDLAESFWKRELGVKDLGGCLPGHGGILDRCDSLIFAVFAVYLYAQMFLVG